MAERPPSPDDPLTGSCLCGTVRFAVTAPFKTAGYCHCTRCQRRTGTMWTLNALSATPDFRVVAGTAAVRAWQPDDDGQPKAYCVHCGGHVFSGDPGRHAVIGVRLGAVHRDPAIRPRWRQWLDSAPDWEPIPDDGLPRFAQRREIDL